MSCVRCSPGEFNDVLGAEACKPCSSNTYAAEKGRGSSCVACPTGYSSNSGSASCVAAAITCGQGTTLDGTECKATGANTPTTTTCSSCKTIASTCVEFAMASDSPTPSGTSATTSRCTPDVAGASPSGVEDASMLLSTGASSTLFVVVVATSMMALVLF